MGPRQSTRPIFIVGCPRSGTTMLQLMLHAHPRIAVPPETRIVLAAYKRRPRFGDLSRPENRERLAQWITGRPQTAFRDLGLDAELVSKRIVAETSTLGSALAVVFQAYAESFGKPRWGEKRPAYVRHIPELRRMYPDAQFVHLIRDGRDCVASLGEMPWYKHDVFHAIRTWNTAIDSGRRAAELLGPESYYELQYEHLVGDTAAELTRLCAFLGEEYAPAMALPGLMAPIAVPARKSWHARTHGAVSADTVGSWSHRLEPWQSELAEYLMRDRLAGYGYPLSGVGRPPAGRLLRYARTSAGCRAKAGRRFAVDRWKRWKENGPIASIGDESPETAGTGRADDRVGAGRSG